MPIRFLSLFAGVGGFDLGLERASWECAGQVEIDPFCQKVLAKHWPNVWRYGDVRGVTAELVREHCGRIDAIVGGVPCQPVSVAGKRKGDADDRWLWGEFLRLVSEIKPVWVLAENPRGVLSISVDRLPFGQWISDRFAALGYELLPINLAAEDVGAPHKRERVFFVAVADGGRIGSSHRNIVYERRETCDDGTASVQASTGRALGAAIRHVGPAIKNAWPCRPCGVADFPRAVDGFSDWLDRNHALGNAIVPQVAEVIGRAILASMEDK